MCACVRVRVCTYSLTNFAVRCHRLVWVYVRARACARLCVNVRVRVSGAVSSERLFVEGTLWSRTRSRCSLEISGV